MEQVKAGEGIGDGFGDRGELQHALGNVPENFNVKESFHLVTCSYSSMHLAICRKISGIWQCAGEFLALPIHILTILVLR